MTWQATDERLALRSYGRWRGSAWIRLAVLALAIGCKSDAPKPNPVERAQPSAQAASSSIDARAAQPAPSTGVSPTIDAAAPDSEPLWLVKLDEIAELMCSCTTPSCTYRFTVKLKTANQARPDPIPSALEGRSLP